MIDSNKPSILTRRRQTCQSWHIKVIFSFHGSAWTAMSKLWKNIPFIFTLRILWKYCQYQDHYNYDFVFQIFFSGFKTAFDVERYLFWVLSTWENVRDSFEEIWPRLDRLCQIWHIRRLGPMLFRAPERWFKNF